MNDSIKARLEALGLTLPATEGESYYGAAYGTMKPFHITGSVLHLSGHVPIRNGVPLHPGRLGETVSIEQGIEAAELTAMNALAGMKQALGDLERVVSLIKSLNFVACAPNFTEVHVSLHRDGRPAGGSAGACARRRGPCHHRRAVAGWESLLRELD